MERWAVLCMCVRACVVVCISTKLHSKRLLFIHGCITAFRARSFSLSIYSSLPLPCAHVGIYSHAPTVFQAAELHGSAPCAHAPNTYHTRTHCCESEEAIFPFTSWICNDVLCQGHETFCVFPFHYNSDGNVALLNPLILLIWLQ